MSAGLVAVVLMIAFVGFRFIPGGDSATQIESIAMLPLINDGGNPDVEYISDGIAESLTSSQSRIPDLAVKAASNEQGNHRLDSSRSSLDSLPVTARAPARQSQEDTQENGSHMAYTRIK